MFRCCELNVAIGRDSGTSRRLSGAQRQGISVLAKQQDAACRALGSRSAHRFANVGWTAEENGALFVHDFCLALECSVDAELAAGDHHLIILRVHGPRAHSEQEPLVFHDSRFPRCSTGPIPSRSDARLAVVFRAAANPCEAFSVGASQTEDGMVNGIVITSVGHPKVNCPGRIGPVLRRAFPVAVFADGSGWRGSCVARRWLCPARRPDERYTKEDELLPMLLVSDRVVIEVDPHNASWTAADGRCPPRDAEVAAGGGGVHPDRAAAPTADRRAR
jgi:hypothetical protein